MKKSTKYILIGRESRYCVEKLFCFFKKPPKSLITIKNKIMHLI